MDRNGKPEEDRKPASETLPGGFDEGFDKEEGGMIENLRGTSEDIIIDGRIFREGDKVYDLVDVIEEITPEAPDRTLQAPDLDEKILQEVRSITERMAREMIPEIAERVIREEIEKLKKDEE